ncbi:MAG: glycosyltransferase family 2 protein [Terriglobales bacterium]
MELLFWAAALLVGFTYAGYPLWVWGQSRWRPRPVRRGEGNCRISIVVAARNEAAALPAKLRNLHALDYPPALREIIVVSDGSTDGTNALLAAQHDARSIVLERAQGKAAALNRGMQAAQGDVVVFTDARQPIEAGALRALLRNFSDPDVGAVSGELMLAGGGGLGLYWELEKKVREWESAGGSTVGATGALYAVRRELLHPLPEGTILDDVYLPMEVARQGKRVLFEPEARAQDTLSSERHEFRRKVRTLTGNYQLLQLAPWLLTAANPLRFRFVCHKLLRLAVPFALAVLLVSSLAAPAPFYRTVFGLQCAFYGLAVFAGWGGRPFVLGRAAAVSRSFLLLNTAAALALVYFMRGKRAVWLR